MEPLPDPYLGKFPTLTWMGRQWYIKSTKGTKCGPGPNIFDPSTVSVDQHNNLSVHIANHGDNWFCAEVISKEYFHYGVFDWIVEGDVYNLDKNVVFAMFLYPPSPATAPDGTNQIDIEFAKWGHDKPGNLDYTLFTGSTTKQKPLSKCNTFSFSGTNTSFHRITWKPDLVSMESAHVHQGGETKSALKTDQPTKQGQVPQIPLRCHMNLWLFKGKAPSDNKGVKVTFKRFEHHAIN